MIINNSEILHHYVQCMCMYESLRNNCMYVYMGKGYIKWCKNGFQNISVQGGNRYYVCTCSLLFKHTQLNNENLSNNANNKIMAIIYSWCHYLFIVSKHEEKPKNTKRGSTPSCLCNVVPVYQLPLERSPVDDANKTCTNTWYQNIYTVFTLG